MKAATESRRLLGLTKLLVVDSQRGIAHSDTRSLADRLKSGDLVVVNRAATLPSRFEAVDLETGAPIEIRFVAFAGPNLHELRRWRALAYFRGDWQQTTEERQKYLSLRVGSRLQLGADVFARVAAVDAKARFFLSLEIEGENFLEPLYRAGLPIQYSYMKKDLAVWETQTLFASVPIAVEAPSASFPISWDLIFAFQRKGVEIAGLYHGAGISSTGDAELDRRLPFEEFYSVPTESLGAIERARKEGRRIVALGSSVTRALESAFANEAATPQGFTQLRLGNDKRRRVVDVLITGIHEVGTSHLDMVASFCEAGLLAQAVEAAESGGYRTHEFGDLSLIDCGCAQARTANGIEL